MKLCYKAALLGALGGFLYGTASIVPFSIWTSASFTASLVGPFIQAVIFSIFAVYAEWDRSSCGLHETKIDDVRVITEFDLKPSTTEKWEDPLWRERPKGQVLNTTSTSTPKSSGDFSRSGRKR